MYNLINSTNIIIIVFIIIIRELKKYLSRLYLFSYVSKNMDWYKNQKCKKLIRF